MGIFDKFKKKSGLSIEEAAAWVSPLIFEASLTGAKTCRDVAKKIIEAEITDKMLITDKIFWEITIEFQFLFLHFTDRIAFDILGALNRPNLMNLIIENTLNHTLENANYKGTEPKKIELKNMLAEYFDRLNSRNIEYASYKNLSPKKGESFAGNPHWEFGKIISNLAIGYEDIFIIKACNDFVLNVLKVIKIKEVIEKIQ